VDLAFLTAIAPPGRWAPDFFFLPSTSPLTSIEDQLRELGGIDGDHVAQMMDLVYEGRDLPPVVQEFVTDPAGGLARLAEAVYDYWQVAIGPYWVRIVGVLEEDVTYRASRSVSGGLFALLTDLHPEVTLEDGLLRVDKPHHAPATYLGAELTLVPSVFVWPDLIIGHSRPGKFELTYAARGVGRVWEGLSQEQIPDDPLGALIGRSRAAVLLRLDVPMSTTHLARDLGQSPATVSKHLSILREGGMVTSWRSGRSVLYRRTPLAETVLAAMSRRAAAGSA
jgi:DNA-binding transcriptional ArsR family regulator